MGMQIDIQSYQTLYREATLEGEPEIRSEGGGEKECEEVRQSKSVMFQVCKGVRQGCTIPPWLFNLFID